MRARFQVVAGLVLVCIGLSSFAQDPAGQAKSPPNYEQSAEDCEKAVEARKREIAGEYSTAVWSLKQRFQKDGDLDKALVADEEWARSLGRKPLEQKDVADFPPELSNLQKEYLGRFETVVETVATDFLRDLQQEANRLAKAGKLDQGRILKKEMDTIKKLFLTEREEKATPQAEEPPEADPVAACEEAIREKRIALQKQYIGELEAMERTFQSQGLLEDLVAAKAERQRFMESPLISTAELVDAPADLRQLQERYLTMQQDVMAAVVSAFASRLDERVKALTIEGKLDEAMEIKAHASRVRQQFAATAEDHHVDVLAHLMKHKKWHPRKNGAGWDVGDDEVRVDFAAGTVNWLELPYVPPAEYDFNVRLVRDHGGGVSLICAKGTTRFLGSIGGGGDRIAGIENVDGKGFAEGGNVTTVQGVAGGIGQNGVEHCVTVRVRKNGVSLLNDGETICDLPTNFRNLSIGKWKPISGWQRKDTLGIRWYETQMRIVGIEVIEVTGKGRLLD